MSGSRGPLAGRRVLVARAREQAEPLVDRIRALGGEAVEAPVLEIRPGDVKGLRAAARELAGGRFTALCLTSPNGVNALADALADEGLDARALSQVTTVACVGSGTAAALDERLAVRPDLVPERATTEALGEAFPAGRGLVLLPRSEQANPVLGELLSARGYEPVEVTAYRTAAPASLPREVVDDLAAGRIDLLAFGSPSTVRNFLTLVGRRPWSGLVVSIGPVTTAACRERGLRVAAEADPHDLDGLVDALVRAATPPEAPGPREPSPATSDETRRRLADADADHARAMAEPGRAGRDLRRSIAFALAGGALAAGWQLLGPDEEA